MPCPGTDPAAALEVVEEMHKRKFRVAMIRTKFGWWIEAGNPNEIGVRFSAPTLPIGIVVAALVATEPEVAHA